MSAQNFIAKGGICKIPWRLLMNICVYEMKKVENCGPNGTDFLHP